MDCFNYHQAKKKTCYKNNPDKGIYILNTILHQSIVYKSHVNRYHLQAISPEILWQNQVPTDLSCDTCDGHFKQNLFPIVLTI